jgi:transposase
MRAVLKAQITKTDRNDARGIAQLMRAGRYRPVHVKTLRNQKLTDVADPSRRHRVSLEPARGCSSMTMQDQTR